MDIKNCWRIASSCKVANTSNAIRSIVQFDVSKRNMKKDLIPLSIGDPTVFGNLPLPEGILENLHQIAHSNKYNGYSHSEGFPESREAVAKRYSNEKFSYTKDDIVLTLGGSQGLDFSIDYLCNAGDNILSPSPGFPLYETLCNAKGIKIKMYPLLSDKNWEIDLDAMEKLIDCRTRAIIVNNPNNPCGSNYSEKHLRDIIDIAKEKHLPIIADEVYDRIVYKGNFVPMSYLSDEVPIFTIGSISKQFIVPGWRLGWIHLHDPKKHIPDLREGMEKLSTLTLGPCTLIQGLLPKLLETSDDYFKKLNSILYENSKIIMNLVKDIDALDVVGSPEGALYIMLKLHVEKFKPESGIVDDVTFMKKLVEEESVMVLCAKAFKMDNHLRIVFCSPPEVLTEAFTRIKEFCDRHTKKE